MIGVIVGRGSGVRRDHVFALPRPHVSASRTTTQPPGVFHVVDTMFVPGS